jgi:hypothetical protein
MNLHFGSENMAHLFSITIPKEARAILWYLSYKEKRFECAGKDFWDLIISCYSLVPYFLRPVDKKSKQEPRVCNSQNWFTGEG